MKKKKDSFKNWIKNKSADNFLIMKQNKISCKHVIAKAKKEHWEEFCSSEVSESKDIYKVWKKVKVMKNGFSLQKYPIQLDNISFPSANEKAEAFATFFSKNSLTNSLESDEIYRRKKEEIKTEYDDPISETCSYINSPLTFNEFIDAL